MTEDVDVPHWWQLPDDAAAGVVRQVAQRNALVALATRAKGDQVEAAALLAIGAFLATTRAAGAIEIPKARLARQSLLEAAMLHPAGQVGAAVVVLWQHAMATRRAEWEARTAAILARWAASAEARAKPARRRRASTP